MAAILEQRWLLQPEDQPRARQLAEAVGISPHIGSDLTQSRALAALLPCSQYLQPDPAHLPPPSQDFADLPLAVELAGRKRFADKSPSPFAATTMPTA
jgi:single-stranded-DNA-specific exonuclease